MKSLKELYKIGFGPSSSHTMGPAIAAKRFLERNKEAEKFKKHSELSYEQCAKIADRLNTFHFLKDIDKKKKYSLNLNLLSE